MGAEVRATAPNQHLLLKMPTLPPPLLSFPARPPSSPGCALPLLSPPPASLLSPPPPSSSVSEEDQGPGPPVARSPQGFPGNRPKPLPPLPPPWEPPPLPSQLSHESCTPPNPGQLLEEGRRRGGQAWLCRPLAQPWGRSGPAGGLAQPLRACQAPLLALHIQLAQTPHTPAPAALRDAQPIVRGRAPAARISYYGMEMSQVQTTRPGCEHPLPSPVFHPGAPRPCQATAPSPHPPPGSARRPTGIPGRRSVLVSQKLGRDVCMCVYLCVCRCV